MGLLGTNDNEAGNDSPLPDGSQAQSPDSFLNSWQVGQVRIELSCAHLLCRNDFQSVEIGPL